MSTQRPTFRVMKNGYDRFAVDDAVERYVAQIEQLQNRISLYQQQLVETTKQLDELRLQYNHLLEMEDARKEAAENIARLSLREANEIIDTAQKNADLIVQESLRTARLILMDLTKLYNSAGDLKVDMSIQLKDLLNQIDAFRLPEMPDMRWLEEAEKKLR
ncbi:MAG: DivIVA domain-containing protein [Solobacterium sp.]|nr:DivIVA domain-containing protein [Solobacterium sp.]